MEEPEARRIPLLRALMVVAAVGLAAIELWRILLSAPIHQFLTAVALTAVWLPLHLRHLHAGVQERRPRGWGWSLALMAGAMVAGGQLLGASWALLLSALGVSALVILPPVAAATAVAACVVYAAALGLPMQIDAVVTSFPGYLAAAVLLRITVQFALVWLVNASGRLASARLEATSVAVRDRGARVRIAITERLTEHLERLATLARGIGGSTRESGDPRAVLDAVATAARDLLAEVRRLSVDLRDEAAVAQERPNRTGSLLGAGAGTVERAKRFHLVVDTVAVGFTAVLALGGASPVRTVLPAPVLVGLCVLALIAYRLISSDYAGERRSWRRGAALVVLVGLAALLPLIGWAWFPLLWPVLAAVFLVLAARVGLLVSVVVIPAATVFVVLDQPDPPTMFASAAFNVVYTVGVMVLFSAALVAAAYLVRLLEQQQSFERWSVGQARRAEQRRLAVELHDSLGQGLAGLALRCDVAGRLIERDSGRTESELRSVAELADDQLETLRELVEVELRIGVRSEAGRAARLLNDLGVRTTIALPPGDPPAVLDRLLGWTVRETTANIIRHSTAASCEVRIEHEAGAWTLSVADDGIRRSAGAPGTGLTGLRERFEQLGGDLTPTSLDTGFRVVGRVPEQHETVLVPPPFADEAGPR